METVCSRSHLDTVKLKIRYDEIFVVDKLGHIEGLAFMWNKSSKVSLLCYSHNFIDVEVDMEGMGEWRITGFYGLPESSRRHEFWQVLRSLSSKSSLPWICIRDFNDLLNSEEKRGGENRAN